MADGFLSVGMDVPKMVDELMKYENKPLERITLKKNDCITKRTGYSNLENLLTKLGTALKGVAPLFKTNLFSVTSSDEAVVSATSTGALTSGDYQLDVTSIAKAHQVTSSAFTSKDTALGITGNLTIAMGDDSFDLNIEASDTLINLQDNINNALDNVGLSATLLTTTAIDGENEYHLMLTSNETGTSHALSFSGSALPSLSLTHVVTPASDAILTFNGFPVTRSSNNITDIMDGLEINLNGTLGETSIHVTENTSKKNSIIANGVQGVVDAYNALIRGVDYVRSKKGLQEGIYYWVKTDVYDAMQQTIGSGEIDSLRSLGVGIADTQELTNDEGVKYISGGFTLDTAKLTTQLATHFKAVENFFTDEHGLTEKIDHFITGYNESTGPLENRINAMVEKEAKLDRNIDDEKFRLENLKKTLMTKYSKLNELVNKLERQTDFVKQQMDSIMGINKK